VADFIQIDRRKVWEQVAAHLERRILSGQLRPGDQLPAERELMDVFGVGRPAIREALIALQRAGLIEIANGARARVAMPTASHVVSGMLPAVRQMLSTAEGQRGFQEVRRFFEVGLARQAARDATDHDLARLADALAANEAAIGDPDRFTETDIAFHFALAEMTGNPVFVALHDAMSAWLAEQRIVTLAVEGQDAIAFRAHRAIFEAIAARDPDRAEGAMRDHLAQLAETYWKQRGGDGTPSA
jgi:GntR family transcriptional repressor for pyruvate dehydrogenase complex